MNRARSLRNETALNSISPERAGGIMYDTLAYINEMQLQGANPLLLSKIYDSVAEMEADPAPVSDLDGSALLPGQLVCIVTGDPDDPEDGLVYRYDGTEDDTSSWTAVGKIGSNPYLEGYQYMGKAVLTPTPTDPGVPTQKVFYQATESGTYGNFGNLVVNDGEAVNLKWDGTAWSKEVAEIATDSQLNRKTLQIIPLNSAQKEDYYINTSDLVDTTETIRSILFPFTGRHIIKAKSDLACKVYFLTEPPVVGASAPLCSGTSGVSIQAGAQIITPADIKYISINVAVGATITSFVVDGVYDLVGGIADLAQKAKINPFFVEPLDATNRVIELYLTGLDITKKYHISQLGLEGDGKMRMTIADENNNEVARAREAQNTKSIVSVLERNSSGITGYAILDIKAGDLYQSLYSGQIENSVVSSLDYSPSIKSYLASGEIPAKMNSLYGADFVNLYNTITWNVGQYLYIYHFGQDDADTLKGCRIGSSNSYDFAVPFFVRKGDIIEWQGAATALSDAVATAAVCATDESGHAYTSILNISGLPAEDRLHYRFVADRDMWVSCNVRHDANSAEHFHWYRSKALADVVDNLYGRKPLFPSKEIVDLLAQCKKRETLDSLAASEAESIDDPHTGNQVEQLCLIHFSDIHNDYVRFKRLLDFKKKFSAPLPYIDDILLTGDITGSRYSNYDKSIMALDGYKDVLMVIGNHDVYDHNGDAPVSDYSDPQYWATQQEKYELWMMGKENAGSANNNIASWGVVQPSGVGVDGYYPCYYYKDYTAQKVRLVVLDCMDRDGAAVQLAWFNSVLSDTLDENNAAYGYHVLVADHFATRISFADTLPLDTGFHSLADMFAPNIGTAIASYADAVDAFINNGGNFVCWLCGHFHWDSVATTAAHPKQLFIAIASASISEHMEHRARVLNQESEDLFNIVAIDTFRRHIRVARIGSKFDRYLQHAGTMCVSYDSTGDKTPHLLRTY